MGVEKKKYTHTPRNKRRRTRLIYKTGKAIMIWNYDKVYNAEVFIFFMVDGDSYIKFLLNLVVMLMVCCVDYIAPLGYL